MNTWSDLSQSAVNDALASIEKLQSINATLFETLLSKQQQMLQDCQSSSSELLEKLFKVSDFQEFAGLQQEILLQCGEKAVENYQSMLSVLNESREKYAAYAEESLRALENNAGAYSKNVSAPIAAAIKPAKTARKKTIKKVA